MKRILILPLLALVLLTGCGRHIKGKSDVQCTKVTVKSADAGFTDIEVTDEMGQKLAEYYSALDTDTKDEDLVIQDIVHVYYSDGAEIFTDKNSDDYAAYKKDGKNYIITIDRGFKEYLGSLADK